MVQESLPVPMSLRVLVQRGEHDRKNDFDVIANEIAEVLIVPKVQCPLCNLEMRACDRFGKLRKQRFLDFGELCRVHDFEDVLNFVKKHDLLSTVDFRPVAQKAHDDLYYLSIFGQVNSHQTMYLFGKSSILLQELNDTVRKLRMIHAQALHLVQRQQDTGEEELVFLFERESKSVDDRTEDFKELGNAVEPLRLVHKLKEDVVDRSSDERSQIEEFAVYPVKGRLQKVSFPGIFGIEKFQKLRESDGLL